MGCVIGDILECTERKLCLCTGMLLGPVVTEERELEAPSFACADRVSPIASTMAQSSAKALEGNKGEDQLLLPGKNLSNKKL